MDNSQLFTSSAHHLSAKVCVEGILGSIAANVREYRNTYFHGLVNGEIEPVPEACERRITQWHTDLSVG